MDFMTHYIARYPDYIIFAGILMILCIFSLSGTSQLTSKIDSLQKQIARMDSTLSKIANQVGVPKDPFDEELKSIMKQKYGKALAIKKVTEVTGLRLKEAKDYVDNLQS